MSTVPASSNARTESTATAYFEAWTTGDVDTALKYVAPDVLALTPNGRIEGAEAFRGFVGNFTSRITRIELLKLVADDESAVLFYESDTDASQGALAAEYLTVQDGLITVARYAFDRLPFVQAAQAQQTQAQQTQAQQAQAQ
ncbi:nuclear transport factor 2 family protein [Kineosporia babensis]|uniref:Nuclear transport factor 2 family protein n=1 Tax=Kineosporia babensis TaxID=499548 RepID=A0A9X1NHS4_9ACTN|nr:nuclear transport factor 2 family protein [Kineosporia babensis]MCD5314280.1 nuclear transport factor 2 family protein [Kineosporia babensis]